MLLEHFTVLPNITYLNKRKIICRLKMKSGGIFMQYEQLDKRNYVKFVYEFAIIFSKTLYFGAIIMYNIAV